MDRSGGLLAIDALTGLSVEFVSIFASTEDKCVGYFDCEVDSTRAVSDLLEFPVENTDDGLQWFATCGKQFDGFELDDDNNVFMCSLEDSDELIDCWDG